MEIFSMQPSQKKHSVSTSPLMAVSSTSAKQDDTVGNVNVNMKQTYVVLFLGNVGVQFCSLEYIKKIDIKDDSL